MPSIFLLLLFLYFGKCPIQALPFLPWYGFKVMKTDSADFCAQGKLTGPYHRNLWTNINLSTVICYEGKYKHPDSGSLSREQRTLNQRDAKFLNIALFKPCCPSLNKREIYIFWNCPWNKKHCSVGDINHAEASDPSCLSWVISLASLISISSL